MGVSAQSTTTQPTHHTPQQLNMSVSGGYGIRSIWEAVADGDGRTRLPALTSRPTAAPAPTPRAAALSLQRASKCSLASFPSMYVHIYSAP